MIEWGGRGRWDLHASGWLSEKRQGKLRLECERMVGG